MNAFVPLPRRKLCAVLGFAAILASAPAPVSAQLSAGDIVVIDIDANFDASTPGEGALVRVHPVSGMRTVLSDFGNAAQGPLGSDPLGMALEASGMVVVVDRGAAPNGLLFRVNPLNGMRTVLSDFANAAQGLVLQGVKAVAVEASGTILVVGTSSFRGSLVRVNPMTGMRALLSDFKNPAQGPLGSDYFLFGITVEPTGTILVVDQYGNGNGGKLFRVNPMTGNRTVLNDFYNLTQGTAGICPSDAAVEMAGTILVSDACAFHPPASDGVLFRVNPGTGARAILSNFRNPAQGPLGSDPYGVTVESSGTILVADGSGPTGNNGILFRVDPVTGVRTVLSDFANPAQGPVSQPQTIPFPQPARNTPLRVAVVAGSIDTTPPVLILPDDLVVEATSADGAIVSFTASASDNVDGSVPVTVSQASGSTFSIGTTMVTVTATDAAGNTATGSFNITVRDTTAPVITSVTTSAPVLWPPNHKMVAVTVNVSASDAVGVSSARIIAAMSSEPDDGLGDGDTANDILITGALTLELRAERSAHGNGRVYTITIEARDAAGNVAFHTTTVTVPLNAR